MFYTGIDPLTMKKVYVATDYHEKQLQRALLQYNRPQNAPLVREALIKLGREDLIGFGPECLIRPERTQSQKPSQSTKKPTQNAKKPSARTQPKGNGTRNSKQNSNKPTNSKNNRQRSKK
jgi:hypothetical protein